MPRCNLIKLCLLAILLALPLAAQAQFTYTTNSGAITITGYSGSGGAVTIPDTINGLPVTSIGNSAFFNNLPDYNSSSLTSVTIPNSVTNIGQQAFSGCNSLTSVNIPNGVTSIGDYAFYSCYSLTSVSIGTSVTSIGYGAFYQCTSLTSVNIPNSVTNFGNAVFYLCRSLTSVNIPNTITRISPGLFQRSGLTSVTIPNSVTSIGDYAFESCISLTSVSIGTSVTNIGSDAFARSGLTAIYFQGNSPSPTNDISVFGDFAGDAAINATAYYYPYTTGWGSTFDGLPTVELYPFTYTTNSGAITITGYTGSGGAVTIPDTINGYPVTTIGNNAFQNSSITGVIIGTNVTNIGQNCFFNCTSLTNISVATASTAYSSLNGVLFDKAQTTIVQFPGGLGGSYTIPGSVTNIAVASFSPNSGLTNVTIPNSVIVIGGYAFYQCPSLKSVIIPNSVTDIGEWAFKDCASLTSVMIGNSVTNIGNYAFNDCHNLASIILGNGVTSIGEGSFAECNITSVVIPSSVTNIKDNVFYGCYSLTNATFLGNAPVEPNGYAFVGDPAGATVYYYYGTSGWSATYDGLPTVELYAPPGIGGGGMGMAAGQFNFNVTGGSNQTIIVEASTNMVNWQPVWTNTLSGTNATFTDPQAANYRSRFYRVRSP